MAQTRKPAPRPVDSQAPVYQLRVELLHLKPAIWRQILVPGSIKLPKLHSVLLWTMGWEGGHLHEFVFGHTNYGIPDPDFPIDPPMLNEARVPLTTALGALKSFTYLYDFGDNWQHRVKVEKVLPPDPELRLPVCLAGRNACPPEDVGGGPGYIEFLEAIIDPSHEEHQQMIEWCGGSFDPDSFDLDAVNRRLSQIKL
jgi:Plasmid pRiA4b ORF-3-like protein